MKHQIHHLLSLALAIGLMDLVILSLMVIIWAGVRFFIGRKDRRLQHQQELAKDILYR